jgi:catechol 2,3-dioxygenase
MSAVALRFSHFGIHVTDMARMVDFYSRTMGFVVTDRGELRDMSLTFLSRDPEEHHQIVLVTGRPKDAPFNVVNQISFRVDTLDDLRTLKKTAEALPYAAGPRAVTHGNAWSLYFSDPEGNRIEAYLDSPWYVPQPLGETFDLDKDDATILAETEAFCRDKPGFKPQAERKAEMRALIAKGRG